LTNFVYKPHVSVEQQDEKKVTLLLTIPENLYYFQGHFPEAAILPGVAQLDWVMYFLREYFTVDTRELSSVDALKFQQIVRPKYQITLVLEQIKENKFSFKYYSAHGQHASGKVVIAS